jgi:hypothetical protein
MGPKLLVGGGSDRMGWGTIPGRPAPLSFTVKRQAGGGIPARGPAPVIWLMVLEIFRGFAQFFRLIQSIPDSLDQ